MTHMNLNLANRHAIVCGSTQGIGRACAEALAQLGCAVTLLARNEQALHEVVGMLPTPEGQNHAVLVADFQQPDAVQAAVSAHVEERPTHILINNTGGPPGGPASEAGLDEYRRAFEAHVICNQILAQAVIPAMRDASYGRIINIISTSVKAPIPNLGVSNTIRGAVANWAKTLATELGPHGITVNNVLPGFTTTARLESIIGKRAAAGNVDPDVIADRMRNSVPARRFGEAAEVAAAVAFLASPAAAYISGINLPVDGGRTPTL